VPTLKVEITQFVDDHQPGYVECVLLDASNKLHRFIEKAPIVSSENLSSTSNYPRLGSIDCVIEDRWEADPGVSLVRVNTETPWGVESTEHVTKFVVHLSQLD
jgi:hypothetical protein